MCIKNKFQERSLKSGNFSILTLGQNCHRPSFWNTSLCLVATRLLPASPNFGQGKRGQNDPAATFCQQGICCPVCKHHFTRWTHPDISLRFRAGGRRVKKFSFSRICVAARDFFCRPAADSILIPLTFPISNLNSYTPNFSGVPQKLTWCQQFGLQIFPKE